LHGNKKYLTLRCFLSIGLTHGVVVAQQILVLLAQVRILVGQQKSHSTIMLDGFFIFSNFEKLLIL
jgi:hypothetical protein